MNRKTVIYENTFKFMFYYLSKNFIIHVLDFSSNSNLLRRSRRKKVEKAMGGGREGRGEVRVRRRKRRKIKIRGSKR